jgi:ElaB/YqjD/DUF883 family membrane-anchored ribosome-binding protein
MAGRDNLIATTSSRSFTEGAPAQGVTHAVTDERSAEEIRQNIAATRDSITETVDQLSSRVQRTLDWKTYVADYPLAATGVAAGIGILLGYLIQPRATPGQRIHDALADLIEDTTHRVQSQLGDAGLPRPGLGQTLRAAAFGTLIKAAGDFARDQFTEKNRLQQESEESFHEDGTDAARLVELRHPRDY